MNFTFTWHGSKNPKQVTLPDGAIETVGYMRDGICLFLSGKSATYERLDNDSAEFTIISNVEEMNKAIGNYHSAQPGAKPTGLCQECDSEILPSHYCLMGHWCGENKQ